MNARIVPLAEEHVEGFHAVLDSVAREERYLAMFKAPPLDGVRKFVAESRAKGRPQFLAIADAARARGIFRLPSHGLAVLRYRRD